MARREKHIVITGAAGGIGRALADHFLDLGWHVTGVDLAACPPGLARREGFTGFQADITDEAAMERVMAGANPIDAVIANAAPGIASGPADGSEGDEPGKSG